MSGPSKVIVLDPDARAARQVQLGFEREGIPAIVQQIPYDLDKLELGLSNGDSAALALVGGSETRAVELVRRARELLVMSNADVPIVFTGQIGGTSRDDLEAAGADEIVNRPAYLRDVVTIGRIMRGVPANQRDHFVGSLVETTGVYTLVRALAALGRSAVLTLIRGLRRGEIRFYRGEVTSAQVGLIHGQAAFHQLLLWTDARFDFAYEDIVRRHQIPLSIDELFVDAERFLEGVRESAEQLSPSMVLEQDVTRVHNLGKQIPTEVYGVLRMFDGHRVLADVLEDSPYRVFETLRVAQKAMEAGLLRAVDAQRAKTSWKAILAIEEWLVGSETRDGVVERTAKIDSAPVAMPKKFKKRRGKKKRVSAPVIAVPMRDSKPGEIDWGALVPRTIGAEVGPLSGVVPAMKQHGEIDVASRDKAREGLEALMDTDKRQRIFPTEIGIEPSVVIRNEDTDEWERIEWEAKAKHDAEVKRAEAEATAAFTKAEEDAVTKPVAATSPNPSAVAIPSPTAMVEAKAEAEAKAARADADAKAKADEQAAADAKAKADEQADADAKAKADEQAAADAKANADEQAAADAKAKADEQAADDAKVKADEQAADAKVKADSDAKAKADAEAAEANAKADAEAENFRADAQSRVRESVEKMRIDRVLRDEADARTQEQSARGAAAEEAKAYAARVKAAAEAKREEAERDAERAAAKMVAAPSTAGISFPPSDPKRERSGTTDAFALVAELVSDAGADRGSIRTLVADPIAVAETATSTTTVTDTLTVVGTANTTTITATPIVTVRDVPPMIATPAPSTDSMTAAPVAPSTASLIATPAAIEDEPSDGIVRMMATVDTAPAARRNRRASSQPENDGPAVKETTGEISATKPRADKVTEEPSILVAPEPSILVAADPGEALVADLAAAHSAIAAATAKAVAAAAASPPLPDAASSSKELVVNEVRRDAVAFTQEEEAFFTNADHHAPANAAATRVESFDDLDEGYQPPKFWDRVFGRKQPEPPKKPK